MPQFYQKDDGNYYAEYNNELYICIDNEMWEKSQIFFSTPNHIDDEIWKIVEL